jgi:hypothetical protein
MEPIKFPVPVPTFVLLSAVVGFSEVPQHIPRRVTVAPPSDVMLPPEDAEVPVILVTALVVIVGTTAA